MNKLSYSKRRPIAYGISNGVLGATLLLICIGVSSLGIPALQISAWPGFVAWACYFAAGGTFNAVKKALAANTAGMLMGIFMLIVCALLGGSSIALGIGVLIGAFLICIETVWTPLSFRVTLIFSIDFMNSHSSSSAYTTTVLQG